MIYMGYVVPAFVLLPIAVAIRRQQRLSGTGYALLFGYLAFTVLISVLSRILISQRITNIPLLHADTLVEFVLLLAYLGTIMHQPRTRRWVRWLLLLFPLYCLVNFLFFQSIYSFNTYTRPVGAIVLIALCLRFWQEPGKDHEDQRWTENPHNWFVSGILLYFSSSLLLFLFSNYLAAYASRESNVLVWNIHATLLLVMYLLFAIGFRHASHRR